MHPASWAVWYWPIWLLTAIAVFLGPEIYALVSGHPENTLSWWVWDKLQISGHTSFADWTAGDFLTFGVWLTLVIWLTFHFFFRRFT